MISQDAFIKKVSNKKQNRQKCIVKILRFFNKYIPSKLNLDFSKTADYVYLTICRAADFDMVFASIYSLYKNSDLQPSKIVIVSDGSWEPNKGVIYFRNRGVDVEAISWVFCAAYYHESCSQLEKWANGHIWGKKMVAILYYSEFHKVLFSDPDILWYGTPLVKKELETCKLKLSIDNSHNYDSDCISFLHLDYLYERSEPINCGALFINGGLSLLTKEALSCITYESVHCGKFAEQTVFALLDVNFDNRWSMNEITSEISDMIQPFFSTTIHYEKMIARHYLWRLKWIYWKDYLLLRLGLK